MRIGRKPDPNVSANARSHCRWPEKHSWWYRIDFRLPTGFRNHPYQQLVFVGIDLCGQILVNGKIVGATISAFTAASFDVRNLLRDGIYEIVVRVTSGME